MSRVEPASPTELAPLIRRSTYRAPGDALRVLLVLVASLPALQPLLARGLNGGTHDEGGHLYRLLDFDLTFRAGYLLPRLAPHFALDYGYATFLYYSPLALYLGEGFRLLGLGYIAALKACFAAALLAGGFGTYLLARDVLTPAAIPRTPTAPRSLRAMLWPPGALAAVAAGLAYVYLPYPLVDVYTRGDLAEVLALGILPIAFWSLRRAALGTAARVAGVAPLRPDQVAVAGVCLALLLLAHNLTVLLAAPLLGGFLLVAALTAPGATASVRLGRAVLGGGLAGLLALALGAGYWLPVLAGLRDLNTTALITGYFDYHHWFVPLNQLVQGPWAYDYRFVLPIGARFNLGRAQFLVILLGVAWAVLARPTGRGLLLYGAAAMAVALWLQQAGSTAVWDHLAVARWIQFPFRLGVDLTVPTALLAGSFFAPPSTGLAERGTPRRRRERRDEGGVSGNQDAERGPTPSPRPQRSRRLGEVPRGCQAVGTLLGVGAVVGLVTASLYALPPGHLALQEAEVNLPTMWRSEVDRQLIEANTQGDYLPTWVPTNFFQVAATPPPAGASPVAEVTAVSFNLLDLTATVQATAPTMLRFDRLYERGWTATLDGRPLATGPGGPLGQLTVTVPAGEHRLALSAGETPSARLGDALSLLGLLLVVAIALVEVEGTKGFGTRGRWAGRSSLLPPGEGGGEVLRSPPVHGGTEGGESRSRAPRWPEGRKDAPILALPVDGEGAGAAPGRAAGRSRRPQRPTSQVQPPRRGVRIRLKVTSLSVVVLIAAGLALMVVPAERPPRPLAGAGTSFGPAVRLVGAELDRTTTTPPGALQVTLLWQALRSQLSDCTVHLRLIDARGQVVAARDKPPEFGLRACPTWTAGEVIRDDEQIRLPTGADGGAYRLVLGLSVGSAAWLPPLSVLETGDVAEARSGAGAAAGPAVLASAIPGAAGSPAAPAVAVSGTGALAGNGTTAAVAARSRADPAPGTAAVVTLADGERGLVLGMVDAPAGPPPVALPGATAIGATLGDQFQLLAARVAPAGPAPPTAAPSASARLTRLAPSAVAGPNPSARTVTGSATLVPTPEPADPRFVARLVPGQQLNVDLLWRSLTDVSQDYAVFTHLVDAQQRQVAQDDGWPDRANFPTSVWFPGDQIDDKYFLVTRPTLVPGVYTLTTGIYLRQTMRSLPAQGNDASGGQVVLGSVKVSRPDQVFGTPVPVSPQSVTLASAIALAGARVGAATGRPGQTLTVDLEWRALRVPAANYVVFVHVLDAAGRLVAQHDSPPLNGAYPTGDWDAGDTIYDQVAVALPVNLPRGAYTVHVGVYRPQDGVRLADPAGATSFPIGSLLVR